MGFWKVDMEPALGLSQQAMQQVNLPGGCSKAAIRTKAAICNQHN